MLRKYASVIEGWGVGFPLAALGWYLETYPLPETTLTLIWRTSILFLSAVAIAASSEEYVLLYWKSEDAVVPLILWMLLTGGVSLGILWESWNVGQVVGLDSTLVWGSGFSAGVLTRTILVVAEIGHEIYA